MAIGIWIPAIHLATSEPSFQHAKRSYIPNRGFDLDIGSSSVNRGRIWKIVCVEKRVHDLSYGLVKRVWEILVEGASADNNVPIYKADPDPIETRLSSCPIMGT